MTLFGTLDELNGFFRNRLRACDDATLLSKLCTEERGAKWTPGFHFRRPFFLNDQQEVSMRKDHFAPLFTYLRTVAHF